MASAPENFLFSQIVKSGEERRHDMEHAKVRR
jgi:hypothetical protein